MNVVFYVNLHLIKVGSIYELFLYVKSLLESSLFYQKPEANIYT